MAKIVNEDIKGFRQFDIRIESKAEFDLWDLFNTEMHKSGLRRKE